MQHRTPATADGPALPVAGRTEQPAGTTIPPTVDESRPVDERGPAGAGRAFHAPVPLLWRTPTSVQFGTSPEGTVVLDGVDAPLARALAAWQRHGDVRALATDAMALGVPRDTARRVSRQLAEAGLSHPAVDPTGSVQLVRGEPVADQVAGMLADAGVRTAQVPPERLGDDDSSLVVLHDRTPSRVLRRLQRDDRTHLRVSTAPDHAQVGPLVVPGRTTCATCVDLHRRDDDPCWPQLAAQLRWPGRRYRLPAWLVAAVAAQVTAQVLHALGSRGGGPCAGATLELTTTDWRWRRRVWPPHPDCACAQ